MKIEEIIKKMQNDIEETNVSPENLVKALLSLLEILHENGLDEKAAKALADCGIKYEYEVEQ